MFYLIYTLETSLWPRAIVADNIEIELEAKNREKSGSSLDNQRMLRALGVCSWDKEEVVI